MAEIPFEYLLIGQESTRGSPLASPTHFTSMTGTIIPRIILSRPNESRGMLASYTKAIPVRKFAEWEAEGPLDVHTLPVILGAAVRGGVTSQQVATGVHLWTFVPSMSTDNLKSLTLFWGDPNIQVFRAAYGMVDELTISADVTRNEVAIQSVRGNARFPSKTAPGTVPSVLNTPLIAPVYMQLWVDSGAGWEEITGRLLSVEIKIQTGVTYKWVAAGTDPALTYSLTGRTKRSGTLTLVMEVPNTVQYDQWADSRILKIRARLNGPLIASTYYYYVEFEIYGPFDELEWGEYEGSNRTIKLTIHAQYDATSAADFIVRVQNDRSTL